MDHDRHPQDDQAADYGQGYDARHDIPAVGAVLAARRHEGQWSVEQVASALKLAPRQVEALEAGDYGALPGMAVARGFIRSYAKLMRIDVEPYMSTVVGSAALNAMPPSRKPLSAVPFSEKQSGSLMGGGNRNSSRVLMASGVVLTLLILASALVAVQRAGWLTAARESLLSSGDKAMAMISARPNSTVAEDAASARLDGMNMTLGEQGVLASAGAPIVPNKSGSLDATELQAASTMPTLTASPMLGMNHGSASGAAAIPASPASSADGATAAAENGNGTGTGTSGTNGVAGTGTPTAAATGKGTLPLIQPLAPGPRADGATAQSPAASVSRLSSALNANAGSAGTTAAPATTVGEVRSAGASNGAAVSGTGAASAAGGMLSLVFREDSWVEIRRADRSTVVSRVFKAGSAESFAIDGPVSLVVGNAHGVEASLRGAPVELRANNNNTARVSLK